MKKIAALVLLLSMVFALCACGKSDAAIAVEEKINQIGNVTLDSGNAISAAERAYAALSAEEKETVENYDVLRSARARYDALVEEARKEELAPIQLFASEVLVSGAKLFTNPLSVKVINVWYYALGDAYYFTYELEVKNTAGITEKVYYGNKYMFWDLSDDTLSLVKRSISATQGQRLTGKNAENDYFCENQINAMQKGEPLDADEMNNYFLKNYK